MKTKTRLLFRLLKRFYHEKKIRSKVSIHQCSKYIVLLMSLSFIQLTNALLQLLTQLKNNFQIATTNFRQQPWLLLPSLVAAISYMEFIYATSNLLDLNAKTIEVKEKSLEHDAGHNKLCTCTKIISMCNGENGFW